jgi:mannose-1-phosphate guanylyltransferase
MMAVGILLVGGLGTRLAPLTNKTPKPMLPIANLPVTEHQLLVAKAAGITKVVLATAYLAETFTPYFGDGSKWGIELKYALETKPLGTGGAIRNAAELIFAEISANEPIVVFNGDVLSRHNLAAQINLHLDKSAAATLHLVSVDDARPYGCVPYDESGRVTEFLEKMENPITNSINAGCYVFNPSVIKEIEIGKVISVEREIFPQLLKESALIQAFVDNSYWLDMGTPKALLKGSRDYVGDRDFLVGGNSQIATSAKISGATAIGNNVTIGENVEIKSSIIRDGVNISAGSTLENVFVEAGTKLSANTQARSVYLANGESIELNL